MAVPANKLDIYTTEDIDALPQGKRAELIDGVIYDLAAPTTTHQRLVAKILFQIASYIDRKGGDCEVFPAPFAVYLNDDNRNYVEPDIVVVCDKGKLDEKGCHGAPDWIIEVVSESSKTMDMMRKLLKYQSSEVHEYWIVCKDHVLVYDFKNDKVNDYKFTDDIPVGIYEGDLAIRVER